MKYSFIEYLFVYLRCEVINMVVVVLKAATSFAGIDYNERKNEEGKSELLVAENFAMNPDNLKKSDYIAYMESVCRTNPAVKAKQFHAVISCKGREYSAEDLKNVALQYINKMGYGNNPYMIYFHSDTENNHVHIVSTRVQKNGQKVKDNMEAVRSQKVINQIMNVDLALKAKDDISKYMEFSFSTVQQYKLLLEQSGWKLREKDGLLILYKGGEKHASIQLDPETNGRSFKGQTLEELERRWRIASQDPDKWWCRYPGLPFSTEGMQRTAARRASYQKFIRDYLRCGATVDDNIGKLLKALDEMNIADNTIVIYVSDQGYFLGEHGFFDKRMFYEESARMPFVIRYPKKVPAGKRLDDLILNVDFAPTLAEFAGVKMENVQGDSFVSNLEGNTPTDWRKEIYYRYWTNHAIRPAHFAIRSDRYKLIFYYARNLDMTDTENFDFTPSWDFYDLQNDPHENHNAYNDPKYAPVIKQMKKDLLRLRKETGDTDEKYPEMQELLEKYYNKSVTGTETELSHL